VFRATLSSWEGQKRNRSWSWTRKTLVQQCCSGCLWLSVARREENSLLPLNSFWSDIRIFIRWLIMYYVFTTSRI